PAATNAIHVGIPHYAYANASCYQCHPQAQKVGLIDHAPFFPIAPGAKHAGLSCSSCHPVAGDWKRFECITCHTHDPTTTNAIHVAVPNYAYASASCYMCHPQAQKDGLFDHSPFFPIATGTKHAGASCADCHADPANRKNVTCAGACHESTTTAPHHTEVGGYEYSSPLCMRCHVDAQVNRVAQHTIFNIAAGAKHYRKSCLACHPATRTDKPWGAEWGAATVTCRPCHSSKTWP
ncbi:MAG TPA: hypothetical protein VE782_04860, partial [Myxococcaceae bacterium]|nr:hypothetical protein [Myxococcaceae bacterium]